MRDEGRRSEESAGRRVIPTLAQIKNCNLRYLRGAASRARELLAIAIADSVADPAIFFSVIWLRFAPWESFRVETRRDLKICETEWIHKKNINLNFRVFSRSSPKSESRTSKIYLLINKDESLLLNWDLENNIELWNVSNGFSRFLKKSK